MTNEQMLNTLFEMITHNETMRALTPQEQQWLDDCLFMCESMTDDERQAFNKAEYFEYTH